MLHDVHPADLRDHQIQKDQMNREGVKLRACFLSVKGADYLIIFRLQAAFQHFTDLRVVFHKQNLILVHGCRFSFPISTFFPQKANPYFRIRSPGTP